MKYYNLNRILYNTKTSAISEVSKAIVNNDYTYIPVARDFDGFGYEPMQIFFYDGISVFDKRVAHFLNKLSSEFDVMTDIHNVQSGLADASY